jgi:hypothetical protein
VAEPVPLELVEVDAPEDIEELDCPEAAVAELFDTLVPDPIAALELGPNAA